MPCILYSDCGYGKTYNVRQLAQTMGLHLVETNSSLARNRDQLQLYLEMCQVDGYAPTLFFFDEVDGVDDFTTLFQIVKSSVHPVVMACNELDKLPSALKGYCTLIKVDRPKIPDVVEIVKKVVGPKADLTKVTTDIRASILNAKYGGAQRTQQDYFKATDNLIKRGDFDSTLDPYVLGVWLCDNLPNYYFGPQLIDSYELLALADYYDQPNLLRLLPRAQGSTTFPSYFSLKANEKKQAQKTVKSAKKGKT